MEHQHINRPEHRHEADPNNHSAKQFFLRVLFGYPQAVSNSQMAKDIIASICQKFSYLARERHEDSDYSRLSKKGYLMNLNGKKFKFSPNC